MPSAKKALSEEVMLVGQYDDVMQALRGATSRNCECLFRTPEPDPVRVAFDGDSLLILKSQIQRFSAVEGALFCCAILLYFVNAVVVVLLTFV